MKSNVVTGQAPSIGKGRNIAETIIFGPDRSEPLGQQAWEEREARTPFEMHSAHFRDEYLAPVILPGEVPGGSPPGTRRYYPLASPPAGGLGTQSLQASEFKQGKLTLSSTMFTDSKGVYLYGHELKCPDLDRVDIDTPGPGSYHDVTHSGVRHISTYQRNRGSSNMFGPQVNSRKRTQPSFRFGEQAWEVETYGKKVEYKPPTIEDSLFYRMLRKSYFKAVPPGKKFYNVNAQREMAPAIKSK
eukprot:CAMPEP_0196571278 /NCGR_PEP_ID=MMETSP1081-20130531/1456_1 /TAXON_ID=36882 /ORGANISM="Pyramimonas amylifera, Strain CCMP720" /LENGTH=243 /DNA_ID=CAMNT_0041888149 /DNA_START=331 /DNA_END=1062 /DNA_ORIENTATION=-